MPFPDNEKVVDLYLPVKIPKPHEFERPKSMSYIVNSNPLLYN